MAKLTLSSLASLDNKTAAIATINSNNDAIEAALENTLSRDGSSPNSMGAPLDMNSYRILNLPAPQNENEPLRLADVELVTAAAAEIVVQASEPSTTAYANTSLWIDSDSTDNDLYQLIDGVWADTGVNIKGATGASGAGSGDVLGPASSVDNELVLFDGTDGKTIKRASTTGILKATSGVIGAASSGTDYAPATSGVAILKGNGSGGFSSAAAGTDYYAPGGTDIPVTDGGTGASSAANARTNLGLVIGTDIQGYSARLSDIAGISFAQGDILYHNGSNLVKLAAGTAGQKLQTNGVGANPSWVTSSSASGYTLLSTQTPSGASSMAFTSIISSTYDTYELHVTSLIPSTDNVGLFFQVSTDNGSTWKTTGYLSAYFIMGPSGTSSNSSGTGVVLADGATYLLRNTAGYGWNGVIRFRPNGTSTRKFCEVQGSYRAASTVQTAITGMGHWDGGNDAVTAVRIVTSSGNLSGTGRLYGLANT